VAASILDAAEGLLAERPLAEITVADVIQAAGVARGSFYFYFESKEGVVAALLERIVEAVHDASLPWLRRGDTEPRQALRAAIGGSLALWRRHAPVMRATVESWQTTPAIRDLWGEVLERFAVESAIQIEKDRAAGLAPAGPPAPALAGALVAMNERSFYFAVALGGAETDDQLSETLTSIWVSSIYGASPAA
jgi:TetR/AcrR family transcriptional regulator, ethionamide resistance regulator